MASTGEPQIADLGLLCVERMIDDPSWVYRRKDSVELLSENLQRHRSSIDFVLPSDVSRQLPSGATAYYVPIGMLRKAAPKFTRFDVTDETGCSLPLPNRDQNAAVSAETLVTYARRLEPDLEISLEGTLREVAASSAGSANDALGRLRASASYPPALRNSGDFVWLLDAVASNSIVVMCLAGDPGERRILKISYDEQLDDVLEREDVLSEFETAPEPNQLSLGDAPYVHTVTAPFVSAQTYHFECTVPMGSRIVQADIWDNTSKQRLSTTGSIQRSRIHLYLSDAREQRTVTGQAIWRITSSFVGSAWYASVGVFAVLLIATWVVWSHASSLADIGGSAPALLLVLPGLVATYVTQVEGELATRLLRQARIALARSAGASYVAAICIAAVPAIHNGVALDAAKALIAASTLVAAWSCIRLRQARIKARPPSS